MNIKTKLDIAGQKVTGIAQQIKGEAEVISGQKLKGNMSKVKGKTNVAVANLRTKLKK